MKIIRDEIRKIKELLNSPAEEWLFDKYVIENINNPKIYIWVSEGLFFYKIFPDDSERMKQRTTQFVPKFEKYITLSFCEKLYLHRSILSIKSKFKNEERKRFEEFENLWK